MLAVALFCLCPALPLGAQAADGLSVAVFRCDVTPPLGQPMIAGDVIQTVEQPLLAKGIVLRAGPQRYVLCAVDWCELCNASHQALRGKIAAAAGTDAAHVAVQCVHQHTAPLVDIDAQKLLAESGAGQLLLNQKVWDEITERLAAAVKQSLDKFEPVDHLGTGQAKVECVAATRRVAVEGGKIRVRYSSCQQADLRALPEGPIDPYLKTITLAQGQKPLVRLHYYATHPQTYYGDGRASSDFVGMVREKLERKEKVVQVYFTGCGGDVTVGKYNDGSPKCRAELAERLLAGMEASIAATRLAPVGTVRWRTSPLLLTPRSDPGHTLADCLARLKDPKAALSSRTYLGALRVIFLQRSKQPIELIALEIGNAYIVHLPGEPMVAFQQYAQGLKPDAFVAVAGYGDCAPGYLCTEGAFREGGYEPTASAVVPESEAVLKKAIAALLASKQWHTDNGGRR
jgi:hypothetical protein